MIRFLLTLLTVTYSLLASAQTGPTGLRGSVKNATGEVLPYAAIIIKGTSLGTITNAEGRYEIALAPGKYEVVFQFLGFQTQQKPVAVSTGFATLDATLEEQAFRLAEVQTKAGNEDPAYTIMRRAIAKSRFHQLQVQRFKARVYTKSSFTVTDLPNLAEMMFRKQLKEAEKEANFKVGVPMLNETVAEVSFSQPNTYRERVIANRNSQGDFLNPGRYFNASFYNPTVAGAVSPLSPKAFAYYKFEYKGTFREQSPAGPVEVSKIQVTPRQYGEGVFRGTIYIIENTWAIHSLQLETVNNIGISFTMRHMCSPIQGAWMPTNQRYSGAGSYLGVKANGQYVRSLTFSEFVVNPAFVEDIEVVDEKKAPPAQTLSKGDIKGSQLEDLVKKQKEFSTKNLRQMVKEYEKQEKLARKNRKEDVAVVRDDSIVVDSLARRRSNVFWDSLRSVPLTTAEIKSYRKADSLGLVREIKAPGSTTGKDTVRRDSTHKKNPNKFSPGQLIGGNTWRLNKRSSLIYTSPLSRIEYNTVEGYTAEAALNLRYRKRVDSVNRFTKIPLGEWNIGGTGRYQFGRKQFVGYGLGSYQYKTTRVAVQGGRYVFQFNPDNPISPFLNSLTTLLFEQNFMKLYQKDFVNLSVSTSPFQQRLTLAGSIEYAQRSELANYKETIKPWIDWRNRVFTPNQPNNDEVVSTSFPTHNALVLNLTASTRLGATQYVIRNGRRIARRDNDSPLLTVNYRKGMDAVDYDFLQASISHSFETGIRSRLNYKLAAGAFLTDRKLYFPDFKHFAGNEFFFQQGDVVSSFRMLPYYQYSTGRRFAEAHVLAEFRKFLFTQLTLVRLTGLKENLFVHYLYTPTSKNYTEIGYGLDGLVPQVLPFFRVEVISQWQDAQYKGLGFRIGTTLKFGR